jgi:hypothetical protein
MQHCVESLITALVILVVMLLVVCPLRVTYAQPVPILSDCALCKAVVMLGQFESIMFRDVLTADFFNTSDPLLNVFAHACSDPYVSSQYSTPPCLDIVYVYNQTLTDALFNTTQILNPYTICANAKLCSGGGKPRHAAPVPHLLTHPEKYFS